MKNKICNNAFCYQSKLNYPVYISNQKFKNLMDLLIISDETKSYHVCTKDFNKFMFNKTKNKKKKYFCKSCLQCFSSESVLVEHKRICLKINCRQTIKLKSGLTELKNYSGQITGLFQIYPNFECILKISIKNINITFLVVLLTSLFVLIIILVNQLLYCCL